MTPVSTPAGPDVEPPTPEARPPSLVDALAPVVVLIGLLILTIVIFGLDATGGPLQVALFTSAVFAGLVALKNGHSVANLREAALSGVNSAMGAIFILLAVGALIGTWNMSGTIATIVSYGVAVLQPSIFYAAIALVCALVGAVTGSSWTTAGTLGVAFVGMAPVLGMSTTIAAGAVISGAYVGDKMSPLSETTVLIPSLVGRVSVQEHIRGMTWTVLPAFAVSMVLYLVLGLTADVTNVSTEVDAARDAIASTYNVTPLNLLPIVALILVSIRRVPPFLSIYLVAIGSAVLALLTQPEIVSNFADSVSNGSALEKVEAIYRAIGNGFQLDSGNATIDPLFSGGGMSVMLSTVWLILGALSFAAVMEEAGFLDRLIEPVRRTRTDAGLLLSVVATCLGLNIIAGDQYVAVVMPSRVFRLEFARRGLAPRMLSRTVEDTGTVTSPLVPWNSCGAYMAGVLGVATVKYVPYAFFNILNPLVAVGYALTGFRIEKVPIEEEAVHER